MILHDWRFGILYGIRYGLEISIKSMNKGRSGYELWCKHYFVHSVYCITL